MSGRARAPPYPRTGVGECHTISPHQQSLVPGWSSGWGSNDRGSKEQAKLEACSKSLHSLVQEPELEHDTSDAPSWAKGSGDAWLYLPCLARVGLGLLASWILGFLLWF